MAAVVVAAVTTSHGDASAALDLECANRQPPGSINGPAAASSNGPASAVAGLMDMLGSRVIGGLLVLCLVLGLTLLYLELDNLPMWVRRLILRFLDAHPNFNFDDVSLHELLAYKLDLWFSTSPASKLVILLLLTISLIVCGWFGLFAASDESLYDSLWSAISGVGLDWTFSDAAQKPTAMLARLVALGVSVGGLLVTALLLNLVSDVISSKVDELKKGKSAVLEHDHTLIIGWSAKIFTLIDQLCMGREDSGGRPIVILSEEEKGLMEEMIDRLHMPLRGSTVICRTGDSLRSAELRKVSADQASSIVILANDLDPDQSDARLLRIVLSLLALDKDMLTQGRKGLKGHIVAEVCFRSTESLLQMLGAGKKLRTVASRDMVSRMMVQVARFPQLGTALEMLTGFEGNEFYIDDTYSAQLAGRRFEQLQVMFPTAVPMGIKRSATGLLMLNPPPTTVLAQGDSVVLLAENEADCRPLEGRWSFSGVVAAASAAHVKGHRAAGSRDTSPAYPASSRPLDNSSSVTDATSRSARTSAATTSPVEVTSSSATDAALSQSSRQRSIANWRRCHKAVYLSLHAASQQLQLQQQQQKPLRKSLSHRGALRAAVGGDTQSASLLRRSDSAAAAVAPAPQGWTAGSSSFAPSRESLRTSARVSEKNDGGSGSGGAGGGGGGSLTSPSVTPPASGSRGPSSPGGAMHPTGNSFTSSSFHGRFLFIGWNRDMVGLIRALDDFVTRDSELWLFSDVPLQNRRALLKQGGLSNFQGSSYSPDGAYDEEAAGLHFLRVIFDDPRLLGSSQQKSHLQALQPLQFSAILILAEDPAAATLLGDKPTAPRPVADLDCRSIATVLLLRQVQLEDLCSGGNGPSSRPRSLSSASHAWELEAAVTNAIGRQGPGGRCLTTTSSSPASSLNMHHKPACDGRMPLPPFAAGACDGRMPTSSSALSCDGRMPTPTIAYSCDGRMPTAAAAVAHGGGGVSGDGGSGAVSRSRGSFRNNAPPLPTVHSGSVDGSSSFGQASLQTIHSSGSMRSFAESLATSRSNMGRTHEGQDTPDHAANMDLGTGVSSAARTLFLSGQQQQQQQQQRNGSGSSSGLTTNGSMLSATALAASFARCHSGHVVAEVITEGSTAAPYDSSRLPGRSSLRNSLTRSSATQAASYAAVMDLDSDAAGSAESRMHVVGSADGLPPRPVSPPLSKAGSPPSPDVESRRMAWASHGRPSHLSAAGDSPPLSPALAVDSPAELSAATTSASTASFARWATPSLPRAHGEGPKEGAAPSVLMSSNGGGGSSAGFGGGEGQTGTIAECDAVQDAASSFADTSCTSPFSDPLAPSPTPHTAAHESCSSGFSAVGICRGGGKTRGAVQAAAVAGATCAAAVAVGLSSLAMPLAAAPLVWRAMRSFTGGSGRSVRRRGGGGGTEPLAADASAVTPSLGRLGHGSMDDAAMPEGSTTEHRGAPTLRAHSSPLDAQGMAMEFDGRDDAGSGSFLLDGPAASAHLTTGVAPAFHSSRATCDGTMAMHGAALACHISATCDGTMPSNGAAGACHVSATCDGTMPMNSGATCDGTMPSRDQTRHLSHHGHDGQAGFSRLSQRYSNDGLTLAEAETVAEEAVRALSKGARRSLQGSSGSLPMEEGLFHAMLGLPDRLGEEDDEEDVDGGGEEESWEEVRAGDGGGGGSSGGGGSGSGMLPSSGAGATDSLRRPSDMSSRHSSLSGRTARSGMRHSLKEAVAHSCIVSEILDARTLDLVRDLKINKYVCSHDFISMLLALICCSPDRLDIYSELWHPGANELFLKPGRSMIAADECVDFYTLAQRASALNEVLLGYIDHAGHTQLNPRDKATAVLRRANVDMLIMMCWS